jgi:hypothetical protein
MNRICLLLLLLILAGCAMEEPEVNETIDVAVNDAIGVDANQLVEETPGGEEAQPTGPGGCTGAECDIYFQNNPEESQAWCDKNPVACNKLKEDNNSEGPAGCGNDCEEYCDANSEECQRWCEINFDKNPQLCQLINMEVEGREGEQRQGDGVWEKNELTFQVIDPEGVLSEAKRREIVNAITSTKKSSGGFYGWNAALEEINKLYPDNIVPDIITEVEGDADFVIEVHSEKEYCCDLAGEPVTGIERSDVDDNSSKLKSKIDIYNILKIDIGLLGDMTRHELGHGLGLFSHVTDRNNDLMSLISPASTIKEANLNDLYLKYRDRTIETIEEAREKDINR